MIRRILAITLFIALLLTVVFGYLHVAGTKYNPSNIYSFIPANSPVVIEAQKPFKLLEQLQNTSLIWKDLIEYFDDINQLDSLLSELDSISHSSVFLDYLNQSELQFVVSFHEIGKQKFAPLFSFSQSERGNTALLKNELISLCERKFTLKSREFQGYEILEFQNSKTQTKSFSLLVREEVLFISFSGIIIENLIKNFETGKKLNEDVAFESLRKSAGKQSLANVFVQIDTWSEMLSPLIKEAQKNKLSLVKNFGNWAAFDFRNKPNSLQFNGFIQSEDSTNNFLNALKNQGNFDLNISEYIPSNTAFFYGISISNPIQFHETNQLYFASKGNIEAKNDLNNLEDSLGSSIENAVFPWLGSDVALFVKQSYKSDFQNKKHIICKLKNREEFVKFLGLESDSLLTNTPFLFPYPNLFSSIFQSVFSGIETKSALIIDNYLILAIDEAAISDYLGNLNAERTWNKDLNFQKLSENLSSTSQLFIYISPSRALEIMPDFGSKIFNSYLLDNLDFNQKIESISLQFSQENQSLFYSNIFAKYNPLFETESASLWEFPLLNNAHTSPILVENHYTKTKEVLIQDSSKVLYLISSTGELIWKKQLDEFIYGHVTQIDVLKNNKLQMLISGETKVYLLDRLGNSVDGFPIQLPQRVVNAATVFDYDKNKNYRILIPTEDGTVHNFEASGKKVNGWSFNANKNPITNPIYHFLIQGKDYLVFTDNQGEIKATGRDGKKRLTFTKKLSPSKDILQHNSGKLTSSFLLNHSADSSLEVIYLNDRLSTYEYIDYKCDYFQFVQNKNSEKLKHLIVRNRSILLGEGEKIITEISTSGKLEVTPIYKIHNNEEWIFWLSNKEKIVKYFGTLSSKISDYPYFGIGEFCVDDINLDGTLDIVILKDKQTLISYSL